MHENDLGDAFAKAPATDDLLLGLGYFSRLAQGIPRSSCTVRFTTTPYLRRRLLASVNISSATVRHPCYSSLAVSRRPISHTSSTGVMAISLARLASSRRSTTPPVVGHFLAAKFASLASVLVGPIPTPSVRPVHCCKRSRIWSPYAVRSPAHDSLSSIKAPSML